jgi:hypothetical protein
MTKNQTGERAAWSTRPRFTPRQRLTAEQLNTGFGDELSRQYLLNRAVHGYGVVMGYGLSLHEDRTLDLTHGHLEIGDGLALDRYGRMLVWRCGRVGMDDLVGARPKKEGRYTLIAHYAVRSPDQDDCGRGAGERSLWTEEAVVFSLRPECEDTQYGCPDLPADRCVSHGEYLNWRNGGLPAEEPGVAPSPDVDWFSRTVPAPRTSCGGGWAYDSDPTVGVPLACLEICDLTDGDDDCEPRWGFCRDKAADLISARPLVYRNPLLYELTRCCGVELPRVRSISWKDWIDRGWQDPVPWELFAQHMADTTKGFEVSFTNPLDARSLHEASIFITVFYQDGDASWRNYRMPLDELVALGDDEKSHGVRLVPDQADWVPSEITGRQSNLFHGIRIEVTIRGQLLHDHCGRMLDARPIGMECGARCQARPGGDLVTAFRVGPHHRDEDE